MKERRQFERYNSLVEIKYKSADGDLEGYCFTKDLSKGGVNLPLDRYISPYKRLILEIRLPGEKAGIATRGLVVWSRRNKFHWESVYSAGLRFENIDPDFLEKVVDFASRHQWCKNNFEKDLENNNVPLIE